MNVIKIFRESSMHGLNSNNLITRLTSGIVFRLIQKLLQIYDPLIDYNLNDHDIKIPLSHALPTILSKYPNYASNLARVASCIQEKYEYLSIIDIGANIGDSVFILRKNVFCPILCIEGDEIFFNILKMNTASSENVFIEKVFVGDADKRTNQELVVVAGTAHFEDSNSETTHFKKLSSVLSEYPQFQNAKMLKIDTDGFDLLIIRGSVDFLQLAKPVIFFEYDPFLLSKQNDDGLSIFPLLQSLGYCAVTAYDNFGRYIISLPLIELEQIEDLHKYLLGRSDFYYDLCIFHQEDLDVQNRLRKVEASFLEEKNKSL